MILNDVDIAIRAKQGMVEPFVDKQVKEIKGVYGTYRKTISYGLGSYGYDFRIGKEFKIFSNAYSAMVDPKNFNMNAFVNVSAEDYGYIIIPPNSFVLGKSLETFNIPRDILALCIGKSTYARCGIIVNVTPLEPEWRGVITVEISNTAPTPAKIYAEEGIAQLIFLKPEDVCKVSYADKKGKYQGQTEITLPR